MGNEINTQYQIKIANLSSYPLTFKASDPYLVPGNKKQTTDIQEWTLAGVSFDGLWLMAYGLWNVYLLKPKAVMNNF